MNGNIRSAAIGGLAATFVVATAFLPRLIAGDPAPTNVVVTPSASQTEAPVDIGTATTLEALSTTSTTEAPPTTTTTVAPTTTTKAAPPTTTTTAPAVRPTVYLPGFTPGSLSVLFKNPSRTVFTNPAVRVAVTLSDGTVSEIVTPLPPVAEGRVSIVIPDTAVDARVVDTEWDGGVLPNGAG